MTTSVPTLNGSAPAAGDAGPGWWAPVLNLLVRLGEVVHWSGTAYGADPTGVADSTTAIQAAINAAAADGGGTVWLRRGTYKITATVDLKPKVHLRGVHGGIIYDTGSFEGGTRLLWAGTAGGTVLRALNCQYSSVKGITVDGGGIDAVTGILIDSTNAPVTQNVTIEDFSVYRCGTLGTNGFGIRIGKDTTANYEIDNITLRNGTILYCTKSISIESGNAMDTSIIERVITGYTNTGVNILACGQMTIQGVVALGGWYGTDPCLIRFAGNWNPIRIINCEVEGAGAKSIIVQGGLGLQSTPITLEANVFGLPTDFRTVCTVVSRGNSYITGGLDVPTGATNVTIESHNDWDGSNGVPLVITNNGGASNVIGPPRAISQAKQAWNPGAIAAGATVTTAVSINCAPGDFVQGSYDQTLAAGLITECSVYSANVIGFYITNTTSGSITPVAGNVRVAVTRALTG